MTTRYKILPSARNLTYTEYLVSPSSGRTFPTHQYFSAQLGAGQLSLYNLLKAYSLLDTEVHAVIPFPTVNHRKATVWGVSWKMFSLCPHRLATARESALWLESCCCTWVKNRPLTCWSSWCTTSASGGSTDPTWSPCRSVDGWASLTFCSIFMNYSVETKLPTR